MKIKLFYTPELCGNEKPGYPKEPTRLPLISLPIIKSFLGQYGFKVEQDDLDIKVFFDNKNSSDWKKKVDMSLFDDRKRIARFIKTGEDEQLEENAKKILKKTKYKNFDVIGFSFVHGWTFAPIGAAMTISKVIKEETNSLVVLGGARAEKAIAGIPLKKIPFIDIFCFLSNHYEFLRLLTLLEEGSISKKDLFPNTIYDEERIRKYFDVKRQTSNKIKRFPIEYHTEEVLFPIPNFDGLPLELYRYIPKDIQENKLSNNRILILPYYFVYGCPNHCIFCKDSYSDTVMTKKPYLVAEELKRLSKRYKTKQFIFTNTSVNPTKEYAEEIAKEMIKQDINIIWSDCATFKSLDKKLLEKLYRAGARRLIYGLECASPRMQEYLEKNINLNHASKILKHANDLNIWNELEIICGLPHETEQDRDQSIGFLNKNKKHIDYFYITKFYLTQSKLTKNPKEHGIKSIRDKKEDTCEGLAFDEVNGLKWEEKKEQMEQSFKVYEKTREKILNPSFEASNMHFYKMFYLYTLFDSKEDIKDYIHKYGVKID